MCLVIHNKSLSPQLGYVHEVTFGKRLRMRAGCQGNQRQGWDFQSHQSPVVCELINPVYVMKPPQKPKRRGFGKLLG